MATRTVVDSRSVAARNWATESSNKIHADDVATQYGFRGGLVPGVSTIAYLIPGVMRALGPAWPRGGALSVRLTAPVYDGEQITVAVYDDGVVRATGPGGDDDRVAARAKIEAPFPLDSVPPDLLEPRASERPPITQRPPITARPIAGPDSLLPGTVLVGLQHSADPDAAQRYITAINDDREQHAVPGAPAAVPIAWLLLDANEILSSNVALGPWLHVESDIHIRGLVRDGAMLETRGVVRAEYERKGHRFVELDALVLADADLVMLVHHTALYHLRPR